MIESYCEVHKKGLDPLDHLNVSKMFKYNKKRNCECGKLIKEFINKNPEFSKDEKILLIKMFENVLICEDENELESLFDKLIETASKEE